VLLGNNKTNAKMRLSELVAAARNAFQKHEKKGK